MVRKILLSLVALLVVVIAGAAVWVASRQNLKFDGPYPAIAASTDSTVIARGHYLVRNVVNCGGCHGDPTQMAAMMNGAEIPLSGGFTFDIPPGKFHVRNITPDAETGIGRYTDGAIARAMRDGIGRDGRALLPFMELQGLSDDDIAAIISYLRSQPPVNHLVPAHEYTLLGNVVKATVLANPVGPHATPPAKSPRGANLENGKYLVESVALCWSCHTQRDEASGQLIGPRYGGAKNFKDANDPAHVWAPPNITSDPETGRLASMSEDDFVSRFRLGRILPGSPMPWQGFKNMHEDDIRAIYQYLKSLPPVKNDVGPAMTDVKSEK